MVMTEFEIARSYRNLSRKEAQIARLSQINRVPAEQIMGIIKSYEKQQATDDRTYKQLAKKHKKNSPRAFLGSSRVMAYVV